MEPWEALDLDDSDLPSILRPCKRDQSQQSQVSSDSLSIPTFPSQRCAPTSSPQADNQPPPSRSVIPGPAGAMQAAMHRIGHRNEDLSRNRDSEISTQDYIKMAEEDDAEEFTSDHWFSALDFLSREGVRRTTSLNDIKTSMNVEKIDMVVAMIKCCTPNGLGDIMVVLKDPTDTIHASIHRKVLTEGDYGRQIAVGSILILQKVSVFSPLNKSFYLNISLSNVVKVIPKDAGMEIYSAYTAEDAAPEQVSSSGSGRTTEVITDAQLNFKFNGTPSVKKHAGEENSELGTQMVADHNSNNCSTSQHRFTRDHAGSNITKGPIEVNLVSSSQEASTEKLPCISSCIQADIYLRDENTAENLDGEHLSAANAFQKQTQVEEHSPDRILFENFDGHDLGCENGAETQGQAKQHMSGVENSGGHAGETNGLEKHKTLPSSNKASFQEWTDDQLDILDMDD